MIYVSSNRESHDVQVKHAYQFIMDPENWAVIVRTDEQRKVDPNRMGEYASNLRTVLGREWPEFPSDVKWSGAWVDCEASDVDPEYTSWLCDWIEDNTTILWEDGEPVIYEEGDEVTQ